VHEFAPFIKTLKMIFPLSEPEGTNAPALSPAFVPQGGTSRRQASRERVYFWI